VPQNLEGLIIATGDDSKLGVTLDGIASIDFTTVHDARQGSFRKPRTNFCRDIVNRDCIVELTRGSVWKGNNRHKYSFISGSTYVALRVNLKTT
jgi:hypothetical protein